MEPVEVVRAWTERAVRGEHAVDLWDPEAVIVNARGWVIEATYRGRDGVTRWWHDIAEVFDDFAWVVDLVEPVGRERVLTRQRFRGTFKASGIAVDMPWWSVLTVRGGLIVHAVGYLSRREALAALED